VAAGRLAGGSRPPHRWKQAASPVGASTCGSSSAGELWEHHAAKPAAPWLSGGGAPHPELGGQGREMWAWHAYSRHGGDPQYDSPVDARRGAADCRSSSMQAALWPGHMGGVGWSHGRASRERGHVRAIETHRTVLDPEATSDAASGCNRSFSFP
jgi:hypothetical protein